MQDCCVRQLAKPPMPKINVTGTINIITGTLYDAITMFLRCSTMLGFDTGTTSYRKNVVDYDTVRCSKYDIHTMSGVCSARRTAAFQCLAADGPRQEEI